jgi:pSer/pThr/pTyr-binding forkhead associated (FHA) protein
MIIAERPTPVFAWLVVVNGPDRGSIGVVHNLHPDTTTIGRVAGNTVVLRDETCSGQHARIRIEAQEEQESAFVLYDMGSRNGTFVGDKETYKDDESRTYRHALQDGDYVLVGETTLVFKRL